MDTTDTQPASPAIDPAPVAAEPAASRSWGKRIAIGGVALVLLSGAGIASALSHGWGFGPPRPPIFGPMMGPGFDGPMRPMLDYVDATDEQEDKLDAIFDKVRDDIRPLRREMRDSRQELAELLSAPTVDAAAVEKLRAEKVAALDETSRKVFAAILEAAQVLTPEQRAKLADRMESRW